MSGDSLVRPPPTGNITRSWWRGQINNPEETRLRRVVATAKLVLREHASLESRKIGDVLRGTTAVTMGMSYPTWQAQRAVVRVSVRVRVS